MSLLPPPTFFEHPADLVVDVFGTFLGKRSERLVVRWRDAEPSKTVLSAPEPAASIDEPPLEKLAAPTSGSCDSDLVQETLAPVIAPCDQCDADRLDDAKSTQAANHSVEPPSPQLAVDHNQTADRALPTADSAANEPAENQPSSQTADCPCLHPGALGLAAADGHQLTSQLLKIWGQDAAARDIEPPTPTRRLREQLDEITGPQLNGTSPTGWKEREVPMTRLRSVTITGRGITVSSDLIAALVERGIALSFLTGRGQPVAQLNSPGLGGTVQTRRSQLAAYDTALGVVLAVEFIRGKLRNQKHQLQYSGKYLKTTDVDRFTRLMKKIKAISALREQLADFKGENLDQVRDRLMGYEGTGARLYWEGVAILLEGRIEFPGRTTRGAIDPINSALNYGYGILYGQVSAAVVNAGLELYAGFLHVDRPGKPALVLDLVEEFRAPVVDRTILAIVNQGIELETDAHGLTAVTRKLVAQRVLDRLSTAVPYEGKRWAIRTIIQNQARHLAVAVRGEREYRSFASRW